MVETFDNREALMAAWQAAKDSGERDFPEGYTVYIEDEQKDLMLVNGVWEEVPTTADGTGHVQMSLYDINRQIIAQLPAFEEIQWEGAKKVLADWRAEIDNTYFLLYGKEISYFTLFKKSVLDEDAKDLFTELKDCLDAIGSVKAFDVVEDKSAIEIWVEYGDTMTCMYLFDYDNGVVRFNG